LTTEPSVLPMVATATRVVRSQEPIAISASRAASDDPGKIVASARQKAALVASA
jgi:hypothetical protein